MQNIQAKELFTERGGEIERRLIEPLFSLLMVRSTHQRWKKKRSFIMVELELKSNLYRLNATKLRLLLLLLPLPLEMVALVVGRRIGIGT